MSDNHTPGPWAIALSANQMWWCIHEEARKDDIDSLVLAVSAKTFKPQRADLRLAAAAPDLLEALEALCMRIEAIREDPRYKHVWEIAHLHCGGYTGPSYAEELSDAQAALKKARGE